MRVAYKVWLDNDGKAFGDGHARLLQLVEESGSLSRAAAAMGMSYTKAWHLVRQLEAVLGFKLLERRTGGAEGGGSRLTPLAQELLERYAALTAEAHALLLEAYARHFPPGALHPGPAKPEGPAGKATRSAAGKDGSPGG